MDGDGEAEARIHPRGIVLDGYVDELPEPGELDDLLVDGIGLRAGQPEERRVKVDVLPARDVGLEADPELDNRRNPSLNGDLALRRLEDAGHDAQQRALAGAVGSDQAQELAVGTFRSIPRRAQKVSSRSRCRGWSTPMSRTFTL